MLKIIIYKYNYNHIIKTCVHSITKYKFINNTSNRHTRDLACVLVMSLFAFLCWSCAIGLSTCRVLCILSALSSLISLVSRGVLFSSNWLRIRHVLGALSRLICFIDCILGILSALRTLISLSICCALIALLLVLFFLLNILSPYIRFLAWILVLIAVLILIPVPILIVLRLVLNKRINIQHKCE